MKYLIIPGMPLLLLVTSLHDANSPLTIALLLAATAALVFGAGFVICYALARLFFYLFPNN